MNVKNLSDLFGGFPGARYIGREELDGVTKVLEAQSPYRFYGIHLQQCVKSFEETCCKTFQRKYALAVSSGTAALHTSLFALGVGAGDEVILPAYAWSADLMAILALGATPVIAPIDETWGLDAAGLGQCVSKKTKAIIAVHMRGGPCDLANIKQIASTNKIPVIEDGSQSVGGLIAGSPVGRHGDISILSFQYNKLITGGEGGVFLTDDEALYARACRFHDLGMLRKEGDPDPEGMDTVGCMGLNYRMSELQAALLVPQLGKMPIILQGLKSSYAMAFELLSDIIKKHNMHERKMPEGTTRNNAFLCLTADSGEKAQLAYRDFQQTEVPVQQASRKDAHHFQVWEAFLTRDRMAYRKIASEESLSLLNRSLFIEINSKYE